jgi:hypothetical protein
MRQYLIIVCVISIVLGLVKFGMMFLCIEDISVLLLTMNEMLKDTLPILLIMIFWLVFYLQVSMTMYSNSIDSAYGRWQNATRTSFDGFMGGYDYSVLPSTMNDFIPAKYSYYLVTMLNLFIANILMLNFMVAILSESYAVMQESGSFNFKCSLYEYCERYLIAFEDTRNCELVLHNPPMNLFTILIIPFLPFNSLMPTISVYFSKFIFWVENIQFLLQFSLM